MAACFRFSTTPIDDSTSRRELADPACGGFAAFEGWVRNTNEGNEVESLEYEAFELLAAKEGQRIVAEACARFGVRNALCVHRVGALRVGELAVWVGVSAPHRDEAFRACRYIIDEVKHRVPIWKKEIYANGDSGWVNCERCAAVADPPLPHAHAHHEPRPDYSRQMSLREVGAAGQARLRDAAVLVVGAGGLGVPVLQYLVGAGVGRVGIVDGDRLEASNLHRQTIYALSDRGAFKAELAAAQMRALNPQVRIDTHPLRLDAANGAELLAPYEIVVDCTDSFTTKFLLNDLAQTGGKVLVLASVHQYEGQLQVVRPARRSSCLRCIWPEATAEGIVGNCAEAGVLGPVPGVMGTLQALETLKIILGLPGQLGDELLLVDLLQCSTSRLKARRHADCASSCVRAQAALANANAAGDLELDFAEIAAAAAAGYALIDIREPVEASAQPLHEPAHRQIPLAELLTARNLPPDGRYLLICARGTRSRAAAQTLRNRGLRSVYSLRGGLARYAGATLAQPRS